MNHNELSDRQADVLKELGNIGAGHAATALSTLLRDNVRMSVSSARMCPFDEIADLAGGAESIIAGVFIRMSGDIEGNIMFLLSLNSAKQLIRRLLNQQAEADDFTELELSAIAEVGNIMGGSYLNAVSQLTRLRLWQSVPAVAVDMAGAILDIGLLAAGEVSDSAILIDTAIRQGTLDVSGHFFLLPDPGSTDILLKALGSSDD
ncbi:chemotaxis protein CheC [Alicyclobacillus tolerans]|uniref:chemotaxis protein CheC n=1 Tax=Alicyclobacillus tolerans TaxID=90970 RepID=UPI001F4417BC|nr:chemotaxis protein CheC [Alicyclobacillus tolerans]MCF8564776.1 chemotaxis protein CheC [Alicyclobacillus tolerans]